MPSDTCPICGEQFGAAGAVGQHVWDEHHACRYCGEQFDAGDTDALYRHWLVAHPDDLTRVDRNRADSAVESLTFSDRLSNGGVGAAVGGLSRRQALLGGGAVAAAAGLGAGGMVLGGGGDAGSGGDAGGGANGTADASAAGRHGAGATETATGVPIPDSPGDHRYATMGSGDAGLTVTYYGNFKCPYCARFSTGFLSQLVDDYVRPGEMALEFRDLAYINGHPFLGPDAPAAGYAGLAVWNSDPDSYWQFHDYVFRNQPSEHEQWATADRLESFARKAGVSDPSVVSTAVRKQQYADALRATVDAAKQARVSGTPALVVDGTLVSALKKSKVRRLIENAIGN